MLSILEAIYENAETYTIVLAWIVVPLGFFTLGMFLHNHYGLFNGKD